MDDVILRPARADDLHLLDRSVVPADDPFNFFGYRGGSRVQQRFAENGLLSDEAGTLIVDVAGTGIGDVSWHRVVYGPPGAGHALNIGISLVPEQRGRGYGTRAQHQLALYLFATTQVHRIEASTDRENIAEQRALTKAGFQQDGIIRGSQWRLGAWHDMVVFSRLRTDT